MTPEESIELAAEALRELLTPDELVAWKELALREMRSSPEAVDVLGRIPAPNIKGPLPDWCFLEKALETTGSPEPSNIAEIKSTGIPIIDKASRFITKPQNDLISTMAYLMQESGGALKIAESRAKDCAKAARLLKEVAALLRGADNEPLARSVEALALWADRAQYGTVHPTAMIGEHLLGTQDIDAGSAARKGRRGKPTRAAAVVRSLVPFFPDTLDFWENGGYSLVAELAQLCGVQATRQSVRSVVEQGRRRPLAPKPTTKRANPEEQLISLFAKPKQ
ncbi:hypothetical protein [Acidithiobacillus sulfurivorans]|uniref:Uncharacterized protein n=1 Tax=Acidithiobacillus sulfurivorans TaxID=1958756 RepID=A0ABS5ZWH3_9PROT|nr:hypothetical protein [Acidithiobacillus sulfurivorans]MBU2759519.1 hypothetical protein [Acidithiobacillus sulfurivorans]